MRAAVCARALAARPRAGARAASAGAGAKAGGARQSGSFLLNLFRGTVEPRQVFPFPEALSPDQRQALHELVPPVERFFAEVNDPARNDQQESIEPGTLAALWELGAFGLQVPAELGGLGLSNTQYARLVEVVGAHDLGVGITLGAHQSIGFKGILLFGNEEQRRRYLPRVTAGEFAAFCLTEPASGSDAGSIKSRAVPAADGSHYVLNGSKIWISNGGLAEILTVFAQTPVERDGRTEDRVTAFVVERAFGGVSSGAPEHKMGIRCSNTAEVYFEDVRVPAANVLGQVGGGFKVAMHILNNGRFGMAAALAGTQRAALRVAAEHAATRQQFGRALQDFGAVRERLAGMAVRHYVTETLAYLVSGNMDAGARDYQLEAAVAKVFASEAAWAGVDDAIQLLGGAGYMRGVGLERVLRDLRIFRIFEGTNDILRLFIALTGVQFAGERLQELQRALRRPAAHARLLCGEAARRLAGAVGAGAGARGAGALEPLVCAGLRAHAAELSRCAAAHGACVEAVLRRCGRGVQDEQAVLALLAEAAVDAYTSAAVLARASRPDAQPAEEALAAAWADEALARIPRALAAATDPRALARQTRREALGEAVARGGGALADNPLLL